ncbi:hypothetical protein [Arsukibacterium indicum]|uniref:Uncharacterized protein n=1 Tax=Arsukibacterium indicum TaxID=2848612 RepID=A0ABS6MNW6_9GAMM|nr:hypothetical protein [Arsukibacterium indicum]MBV2130498.1 hypothetical protein [Arsukibacterium indicum]
MFWNTPDLQPALTACQQQLDESNAALQAIRTHVAYIEFTPRWRGQPGKPVVFAGNRLSGT